LILVKIKRAGVIKVKLEKGVCKYFIEKAKKFLSSINVLFCITLMKEQSSQVTETKSSYQPWNKGLLKPYQGALKVFFCQTCINVIKHKSNLTPRENFRTPFWCSCVPHSFIVSVAFSRITE